MTAMQREKVQHAIEALLHASQVLKHEKDRALADDRSIAGFERVSELLDEARTTLIEVNTPEYAN